MTQPIDIPSRKTKPERAFLGYNAFPAEDGPYMGYVELFESGHIYHALSTGSGKFVEVSPRCTLPDQAFIIEKDRSSKTIILEITSPCLKQAVHRAVQSNTSSHMSSRISFDVLLRHYDALKAHLRDSQESFPLDDVTSELRLLVRDILPERALYEGIGIDLLYQKQVLCVSHLQDIHSRSIGTGLDDIDDCLAVGIVPEMSNEQYLNTLNEKYADLARTGNYSALRDLCEPIVRSGEVELHYSPNLLLEVLDNGHLQVYQYMLDLVDRTKDMTGRVLDSHFADVTFDPFYIAIRLGQLDTVRLFIEDDANFEGFVFDDVVKRDLILTPLTAAVFWHQTDIVRLLLASVIYTPFLPQATVMSACNGSTEVLQVLRDYQPPATPPGNWDGHIHAVYGQSSESISPQILEVPVRNILPPNTSSGECISGIASALSSLENSQYSQRSQPLDLVAADSVNPFVEGSPFSSRPPIATPIPGRYARGPLDASLDVVYPHSRPNEVLHPFVRETTTHRIKRCLGRNMAQSLEQGCSRVKQACYDRRHLPEFVELSGHFTSTHDVWKSGIDCFRSITKNRSPTGLAQIFHCLLVADSMMCELPDTNDELQSEFIKDLGRWRMPLCPFEKAMFDSIIQGIWEVQHFPFSDTHEPGSDNLLHFQNLTQYLVSVDSDDSSRSVFPGSRLRTAQRQVEARGRKRSRPFRRKVNTKPATESFQSIGSVLQQFRMDSDTEGDEEMDIGDLVDLEALGSESETHDGSINAFPPATTWKHVTPVVVLLLASVAFSVVLRTIPVVQDAGAQTPSQTTQTAPPGYARSRAIAEDFLTIQSSNGSAQDSGIDVQSPMTYDRCDRVSKTKVGNQRNFRLHVGEPRVPSTPTRSRQESTRRAIGKSSSDSSSFVVTDFSSPDNATRSVLDRRFKCTSPQCPKSFSSVSNRNKHIREGCAYHGDKKRYHCRNDNCSKVLTTKWYRNTHEQTRCRFKKAQNEYALDG